MFIHIYLYLIYNNNLFILYQIHNLLLLLLILLLSTFLIIKIFEKIKAILLIKYSNFSTKRRRKTFIKINYDQLKFFKIMTV